MALYLKMLCLISSRQLKEVFAIKNCKVKVENKAGLEGKCKYILSSVLLHCTYKVVAIIGTVYFLRVISE